MNEPKRTRREVLVEIYTQLQFIGASAVRYDEGYFPEGKRIANSLALLLIDRRQSKSLLSQLTGKKHGFFSTKRVSFANNNSMIVGIGVDKCVAFEAQNYSPKCIVQQEEWLEEDIWRKDSISTTRKDIILAIRDRQGGAHFDPTWKKDRHRDLLEFGGSGIEYAYHEHNGIILRSKKHDGKYAEVYLVNEIPPINSFAPKLTSEFKVIPNLDMATIRQIANEVLETFIFLFHFQDLRFLIDEMNHRKVFFTSIGKQK